MGDRSAGQSQQIPLPVRIPVSSIRAHTRPLGSIASPNFQRPPMVNQVYLLPKSGLGGNIHPTQPSVMQVRSLATGHTTIQPNGIVNSSPFTPRVIAPQSSTKIVGFFNQLMELSKNVSVQTHNSVVILIQALVNGELDASIFCTQLRTNLKSANTSMDLAPFVKDNIESLRKDLSNGLCRLPNIQAPPPRDLVSRDLIISASLSTTTMPMIPNAMTLQARSGMSMSTSVLNSPISNHPRLNLPTGLAPRIVGTLMTSMTSTNATQISIPSSISTPASSRSQPLLAPAPPRLSSASASLNSFSTTSGGVPKYRLSQPIGNLIAPGAGTVAAILPNNISGTVVASRFTQPTTIRSNFPNLRPIASAINMGTSTNLGISMASLKPAGCITNANITPLLRAKPTYANINNTLSSTNLLSSANIKTLVNVGPQSNLFGDNSDRKLSTDHSLLISNDDTRPMGTSGQSLSSIRDHPFFPPEKIRIILDNLNVSNFTLDATICLSHGLQVFIKSILAKLYIQVSHRLDRLNEDVRLVQTDHNTKEQLRFLQKLDEHNRLRQSELEKDLILKAAKSRSRNEDPHHLQMREMARRIATEDYEREKQHQANLTALHAIGPQRKRRLDQSDPSMATNHNDSGIHLIQNDSLSTGGDVTTTCTAMGATNHRLSVIGANRLGSLVSSGGSHMGFDSIQTNSLSYPLVAPNMGATGLADHQQSSGGPSGSAGFSLAHSLRIHRATLRDVQIIMGRNPRLRRTRTFYRTYWRSTN